MKICFNRGEREKMMAKTEMEDLRSQLEQSNKAKVFRRSLIRPDHNVRSSYSSRVVLYTH